MLSSQLLLTATTSSITASRNTKWNKKILHLHLVIIKETRQNKQWQQNQKSAGWLWLHRLQAFSLGRHCSKQRGLATSVLHVEILKCLSGCVRCPCFGLAHSPQWRRLPQAALSWSVLALQATQIRSVYPVWDESSFLCSNPLFNNHPTPGQASSQVRASHISFCWILTRMIFFFSSRVQ